MLLIAVLDRFYPQVTGKCVIDVNPVWLSYVGVLYFPL